MLPVRRVRMGCVSLPVRVHGLCTSISACSCNSFLFEVARSWPRLDEDQEKAGKQGTSNLVQPPRPTSKILPRGWTDFALVEPLSLPRLLRTRTSHPEADLCQCDPDPGLFRPAQLVHDGG